MSVQTCCRDQRKMRQVIDQIKMLANNLDELREEINTLKNKSPRDGERLSGIRNEGTENMKVNVLQKLKKYVRKMTNVKLIRSRQMSKNNPEVYHPCANIEPPVSSFLSYILRMGKKEDAWQIPTGIKYMKNEGSQTDGKFRSQQFVASVRSPRISKHINSIENMYYGSPLARYGSKRDEKIMYPRKHVSLFPQSSEISCELDSQVENPTFFPSASKDNIFPNSWPAKTKLDYKALSPNMEICLLDEDNKQFASTYTQTKVANVRQRPRIHNVHSKHPHLYFSRIRNAVITKRLTRKLSENTYTSCEKVRCVRDRPYLRKEYYEKYASNEKERNTDTRMQNYETSEKRFSSDKVIQRLKNVPAINDDQVFHSFCSEEEQDLSSSSVSVELEVNVSSSSNKIEEHPQRRKPRTYIIRKKSHNQNNWLDQYEKSIIYVGQTSNLTLSSHSLSSSNIL